MKFRYDKASGEIVEKPEPQREVFDLLPVSPELHEQLKAMQAMQNALRKAFG